MYLFLTGNQTTTPQMQMLKEIFQTAKATANGAGVDTVVENRVTHDENGIRTHHESESN